MARIEYDKIVRDKIPEIIAASGKKADTDTLSAEDAKKYLMQKLHEETAEYCESGDAEELCDIMEVIAALAKESGETLETVEAMRRKKREERGGFDKRIRLNYVDDRK